MNEILTIINLFLVLINAVLLVVGMLTIRANMKFYTEYFKEKTIGKRFEPKQEVK